MSVHANSAASDLLEEMYKLRQKIESTNDSAFMRLMYELKIYQIEIELQRRELEKTQKELEDARVLCEELYDFSPLAYFTFDTHGSIFDLNSAGAGLLAIDNQGLLGASFIDFIARHDRRIFLSYVYGCISGDLKSSAEFELVLDDGRFVKVQSARVAVLSINGNIKVCRMAFMDVTDLRIAELKQRLTSQVLENTQEGIMLTDAQRRIVAVNEVFLRMTGYDNKELIGYTPSILKSGRHGDEFYREMNRSFITKDGWQGEIWNKRKNGDIYQEWANIQVMRKRDGEGEW
jgi:PAS domain S-box-containing protein